MKRLFHLNYRLCPLAMFLLLSMVAQAQTAVEAWVRRYSSAEAGSQDYARKVVTDPDGNVIVAGLSDDGFTGADILLIKYSGTGVPLWTNRYNGLFNTDDHLADLAVDRQGNVFATGYSYTFGSPVRDSVYVTIAYSSTGVVLWINSYTGPRTGFDRAHAIAVDAEGNVVVTGDSDEDYATVKYSGAGVALWTNRYDTPADSFSGVADVSVDDAGNIFVTGSSEEDYLTIAYSGAGVPLWTNRYNGPGDSLDSAVAVAVDNIGNVFVTGTSYVLGGTANHDDYVTIAYSSGGVPLWTNRYSSSGNFSSHATALAVDHHGNVFVTGYSITNGSPVYYLSYATIAYSGAGVALWTNRYAGGSPSAITVDNGGNVLVTGSGEFGEFWLGQDSLTIKYSATGVALWTNRYGASANSPDETYDVCVDADGNVFVTGFSIVVSGGPYDWATVAYSSAGVALWTNRYDGPHNRNDGAAAVAVDHSVGNVLVTGTSGMRSNSDYVTIAYSDAGVALWTNHYNGPDNGEDKAIAVAVDNRGNVFVTGNSGGDYATIAYSAAGVALWTNRYSGPDNGEDEAIAVAVDNRGNVFVTGNSGGDYATIAYSAAGVALWTNRYNKFDLAGGPDAARAMAVDSNGNVFVTGYSRDGNNVVTTFATVAYSGAGVPLWTNWYNHSGNFNSYANAIAVDGSGNVFVAGSSSASGTSDYATIAYSGSGVPLWTNRYGGRNSANAVAVDRSGNVFVTGSSYASAGDSDYATIAYSGSGVPLWTNRYGGPGNFHDYSNAVAVDSDGNVFVTGVDRGGTGNDEMDRGGAGNDDYVTIAYSGAGVPLWTNRYNGPANGPDEPQTKYCLAVGPRGAVYVTGRSDGNHRGGPLITYDYATIKYVWRPHFAIQPLAAGSSTVNLNLSAPPNSSWSILRAPAIAGPWTDLGVSLAGTNGSARFTDPNPPANGAFYRVAPP